MIIRMNIRSRTLSWGMLSRISGRSVGQLRRAAIRVNRDLLEDPNMDKPTRTGQWVAAALRYLREGVGKVNSFAHGRI